MHTYIYRYIDWLYIMSYSTTTFHNNFAGFACWGYLIPSELQNQLFACSAQPGQKCESGLMFNTKMPAPLHIRDCVLLRGADKGYIEYYNEDKYVTVWFIVGKNT